MASDKSGDERSDVEALRVTRGESRAVLDHQLALLNDLDDKAVRTTRTAVILLGILISAAGIAGPSELTELPPVVQLFLGVGGPGLFTTAFVGIGTYAASDMTVGVSREHRAEVEAEAYSEREWLSILLDEYGQWTDTMRDVNEKNAKYVGITRALLGLSLLSLFAATALLVVTM